MAEKPQSLIKASEISGMNESEFHHPLNGNNLEYQIVKIETNKAVVQS